MSDRYMILGYAEKSQGYAGFYKGMHFVLK